MKFLDSKIGRLTVMSAAIASLGIMATAAKADRLADVKKAGILHCGVVPGVPGYAYPNKAGKMVGFDVDLCRAVAAMMRAFFTKPGNSTIHCNACIPPMLPPTTA